MNDCANRDKVLNEKILRWRVDSNQVNVITKIHEWVIFFHFVRAKSAFSAADGW